MNTRNLLLATLAIGVLVIPSTALAGANPVFTVPLHAMEGIATSCQDYLPVDCLTYLPTVNVAPNSQISVFVFVANHSEIEGLATAFEWSSGWTLVAGSWFCQGRQLSGVTPGNPGGRVAGSLVTAFDCVANPALAVVGYMLFTTGSTGCLSQINPLWFDQVLVAALDCDLELDEFDADDPGQQLRLGKICVNEGGHAACQPLPTPVESATWGKIKAQYRDATR